MFTSKYKQIEERVSNVESKLSSIDEKLQSIGDILTQQTQRSSKIVQYVKNKDTEYKESQVNLKNEIYESVVRGLGLLKTIEKAEKTEFEKIEKVEKPKKEAAERVPTIPILPTIPTEKKVVETDLPQIPIRQQIQFRTGETIEVETMPKGPTGSVGGGHVIPHAVPAYNVIHPAPPTTSSVFNTEEVLKENLVEIKNAISALDTKLNRIEDSSEKLAGLSSILEKFMGYFENIKA